MNRLVDTAGEGESGTNGDSGTDIYTRPRVKQIARGKLLTQGAQPGALRRPRGVGWWGRIRKEVIHVYLRLIHADVHQKPTQHCKTIIL